MATVYRAMDPRLGRLVALKLLKGDDPDVWRRFCAEARAQARVVHDNVCRVYEAGEADGEPYIAMQLIDGKPISDIAPELTVDQRVSLIQKICVALQRAHSMGMIHRDIKPDNILVEELEDGSLKPYIMDFGLVRQVEDRGQTQTGAILGTPSYMSPEQALGNVRAMDRRSDVYSLGATLYDLIAGRPPFVSELPWQVLLMIADEDAPPLGKVKLGVPADLETIVMKCLERDPRRRYDSAKALADDLQRYLDGDPILAKRASYRSIVWKKARKNKPAATLLGTVLCGAIALAGVSIRAQRRAAEQARIAQELGEDVKEMELFLRAAYELPLHDVERERDIVRRRLDGIERRVAAAGEAAEGPGQYALGQGYLALGDPARAREHLERALAAGYSPAELKYALGRALGELFRRALEETKRVANEDERKRLIAERERALRDPALQYLRAAAGATIESPAYAEGLIALYEGKNQDAIEKASRAFRDAPWMYEAKKLEGDALYAEGSKYRHDAAFDYQKMMDYFEPAGRAYRAASEIGRSDPDVHRAECELWEKAGQGAYVKALTADHAFDMADAACDQAVQSSSRDGRALVQRANVLTARVESVWSDAREDTLALAEKALRAAEESAKMLPDDVMARYTVASALRLRAQIQNELGRPASMVEAIAAYERVLELDPRFAWAQNELGDAYFFQARREIDSGQDATETIAAAIKQYERALALDPRLILPAGGRLKALTARIESGIDRGQDVGEPLRALFGAVDELDKTGTSPWLVASWRARAHQLRGAFDLAQGRDATASIEAAVGAITSFAGELPKDYWLLIALIRCRLVEAESARRQGKDVAPALAGAREAERKARDLAGSMTDLLDLFALRIDLAELRDAALRGAATSESFNAAFARARPLVSKTGVDPDVYKVATELHVVRGAWLLKNGRRAEEDVRAGLALTDAVLAKNPHSARALFLQGQLYRLRAQTERGAAEREAAARRAREALEAAVREDPLLAQEGAASMKEVERL